MTTLTLTWEQREKVANECGLSDPNSITAEHIDIYSRRRLNSCPRGP